MENQYVKHLTIEKELEWYEKKIKQMESYVDSFDLSELKDRIEWKPTAKGGTMPMVIASKEAQAKSFADIMEKIGKLYTLLDDLRNKYAEKEFVGRGKVKTEGTAMDFLARRKGK